MSPLPTGYASMAGVVTAGGRRVAMAQLYHQTWTNPEVKDADGFMTTVAGPNTATATYAAADATALGALVAGGRCVLPTPRNVVITVTHATSIVALSGVITGLDINGDVITEAWAVTATGTSKTNTGKKALKTIISVTVVAATNASADSVVIGTGDVLGLDVVAALPAAVQELYDAGIVTNGTVVAGVAGSATADARGTYAPNTAPDGAHDYEVVFVSDDPVAS